MSDTKISALPTSTTPLAGTEVLPIVQSGVTKKVAVSDLTANRSTSVGNLTVTTAATTALGSANITSTDPTFRISVSGGTVDKNSYEFRAIAVGAGFDYLQLRKINDARTLFTELYKFDNNGDFTASLGNLVIGTAGKGIDFSADGQAAGMTSELLDDYEEGTWTPDQGGGLTVTGAFTSSGVYTKIGRLVVVQAFVAGATSIACTANGNICTNLPFAAAVGLNAVGSAFTNNAYHNIYGTASANIVRPALAITTVGGNINFTLSYMTS